MVKTFDSKVVKVQPYKLETIMNYCENECIFICDFATSTLIFVASVCLRASCAILQSGSCLETSGFLCKAVDVLHVPVTLCLSQAQYVTCYVKPATSSYLFPLCKWVCLENRDGLENQFFTHRERY